MRTPCVYLFCSNSLISFYVHLYLCWYLEYFPDINPCCQQFRLYLAAQASVGSDESVSTLASEASSATADQAARAKIIVFRRKLKEKDLRLAEKSADLKRKQGEVEAKERVIAEMEDTMKMLRAQIEQLANNFEIVVDGGQQNLIQEGSSSDKANMEVS